jgi:hypothetical protein
MLMYGLTLRHGWGCRKNEKAGFKWLMKAAESAVGDLERVRTSGGQADVGVVQVCVIFGFARRIEVDFEQTELVLAIYEVGQCFFHGWGVMKDQKMAVVSFDCIETKVKTDEDLCRAITWLQHNLGTETRRGILRTVLRMEKGARKTRRRRRDGIEQRCRRDKVMLDLLGFSRTSTCRLCHYIPLVFMPRRVRTNQAFHPQQSDNVKHTKVGVWDLYQDLSSTIPPSTAWPLFELYATLIHSWPYVWRMIKDIASLRQCWPLFASFLAVELVSAIVPAISVYYSGQLLNIVCLLFQPFWFALTYRQVQTAVEHRTVDANLLVTAISGTFLSSIVLRFLYYARKQIARPLHLRIKLFYSVHIFRAMVRLDVPTFDDPAIQHQLAQAFSKHSHSTIAFNAVTLTVRLISTALQLVSHIFILARVLRNQPDGLLLAVLYFSYSILQWSTTRNSFTTKGGMYIFRPTNHVLFNIFQSGLLPPVMKITSDQKVSSSQSTIPHIARRLSPPESLHFSLPVRPL